MIKSELIARLAARLSHLSEKQVAAGVNSILAQMASSLRQGIRIEIRGFGSFSLHHRLARNARNPRTGEKVITAEKYSAHFKPGKELRERVNASRDRYPIKH